MPEPLTVHNLGSSLESWYQRHAEGKLTQAAGDNFRQLVRNAAYLQERALEYLDTIEALALKLEARERAIVEALNEMGDSREVILECASDAIQGERTIHESTA